MPTDDREYLLPEGIDVPEARAALAAHLELDGGSARSADRTYYDTFDGRLHADGLRLIHEDGRLLLRDAAGNERAAADHRKRPRRLSVDDLPAGRLRELLAPVVEVRVLTPVARTRSRLLDLRVLDDEAKTVVRLEVEAASARANGRPVPLPPRVRVAGVRGYDKALARVQRTLATDVALTPAAESLPDAAVRAAGGLPGGTPSKLAFVLHPDQRADSAAVVLLTTLLATAEANLPGTLADVDVEFLHDFRVSVRRWRSAQRQLAGVFPPAPLEHFRAEFRWLQQVTGPTRDLDVQLLELDDQPELDPLRALLAAHRRRERGRMRRALRSGRTTMLLADWAGFLDELVASPEDDRPDAARPVTEVAGDRIAKVYGHMVREGKRIGDDSPHEALHDLRKRGKELRYLLEFFAGLYPAEVVRPMVKTLKALQDSLGRFQDREIQVAELHSLGGAVAALPNGPAALMAMGRLVDRLHREQADARAEFDERFAAFAAKPQRTLVRKTFR